MKRFMVYSGLIIPTRSHLIVSYDILLKSFCFFSCGSKLVILLQFIALFRVFRMHLLEMNDRWTPRTFKIYSQGGDIDGAKRVYISRPAC